MKKTTKLPAYSFALINFLFYLPREKNHLLSYMHIIEFLSLTPIPKSSVSQEPISSYEEFLLESVQIQLQLEQKNFRISQ